MMVDFLQGSRIEWWGILVRCGHGGVFSWRIALRLCFCWTDRMGERYPLRLGLKGVQGAQTTKL